jgi:HEAT repeat protein
MKKTKRGMREMAPNEATLKTQNRHLRLEWPLLAFPIAVLGTLLLLHIVDRSIRREVTAHLARTTGESVNRLPPAVTKTPDATTTARRSGGPGTGPDSWQQGAVSEANDRPVLTRQSDQPEPTRRAPVAQSAAARRTGLEGLKGAELIVVVLQGAIRDKDQTRIKQCLDDLVALGDQAIAPLSQVISSEGGEEGLWAAEALARIGSPVATATLLDTLSQVKEGPYKEELAKRVAGITNHESWPVLLDNALQTADSTVLRAAGSSLAQMADTPVVDELIARFGNATNDRDIERITQLMSNISSSKATESLIALAGDVASGPQDALEQAAIEALGKIGDPQAISYLMRKLEAAPPGEGDYLFNTIAQIKQPQGEDALLSAAAGNKEVSAEHGRLAAICALVNYPDSKTCQLLEQIVTEENERVSSAAARVLEDIRRTSPHVVANAQPLEKKDPAAPAESIEK